MNLHTKSIQAEKEKKDGVRVCIMRRPASDAQWDIWIPHLAPSHELLNDYHEQKIDWMEYCVRFQDEVLDKEKEYMDIVIDMSKKRTVTLLCWEETPEMCHRRLVAEACKKLDPNLKVFIR